TANVTVRDQAGFQVRIELPAKSGLQDHFLVAWITFQLARAVKAPHCRFVQCHRDCIRYCLFGFPDFMADAKMVSTGSLRLQIGKQVVNEFLPSAHGLGPPRRRSSLAGTGRSPSQESGSGFPPWVAKSRELLGVRQIKIA
ncbi:MAG: hypothetical protein WB689_25490, partial [Xanthobacteraceae bacterium]